jgi:pectate lyase
MVMLFACQSLVLLAVARAESVPGFAKGTVGGGDTQPIIPTNLQELESLLQDAQPRVIVLDRTFDYTGSMGREENADGCIPENQMNRPECESGGQPARSLPFWNCDGKNPIKVAYDVAAVNPMTVTGRKTLRGLGRNGRIVGRGLRLMGQNIIIQNIHITELNPHLIWGGDAIYVSDPSDLIWIDHVRISAIGRQMIVTDTSIEKSRITISNCEFDGRTEHSATCDGHHYWTLLFYGKLEYITLFNNYIHSTSGRSPKLGRDSDHESILHAVNNMFDDSTGHCFDAGHGGHVLIERNIFRDIRAPLLQDDGEAGLVVSDDSAMCRRRFLTCSENVAQGSTAPLQESSLWSIGQSPFDWKEVREGCQSVPDVPWIGSYSLLTDQNWGVGVMVSSSMVDRMGNQSWIV